MKTDIKTIFLAMSLLIISQALVSQINYLEKSLQLHKGRLNNKYVKIKYEEVNSYFSHSYNPGEIDLNKRKGNVWFNSTFFEKVDTLITKSRKTYTSKVKYNQKELFAIPFGSSNFKKTTQTDINTYIIKTLRFTPLLILQKIKDLEPLTFLISDENSKTISYSYKIEDYFTTIKIKKSNYQVESISLFYDIEEDDQFYGFGDVKDVYYYKNYITKEGFNLPTQIIKNELNGKLSDTLNIKKIETVKRFKSLVNSPKEPLLTSENEKKDISVQKYSDNVYLINLHHIGARSLLVEFKDFLLVAEAPLNSKYGEELISEVKKINSEKPIKYFLFGHFHPHYTGGIRPFISLGSEIVCLQENKNYITSIAESKFTLKPDQLELSPKKVKFNTLYQAKTISDGEYYMTIYHIGKKSNHTNDYLIYYFPKEKMIFEDDLIWIDKNSNSSTISEKTKGFYTAVKDLNIDVNEVIQSWHVFDKEEKMIFKFKDLEYLLSPNKYQ